MSTLDVAAATGSSTAFLGVLGVLGDLAGRPRAGLLEAVRAGLEADLPRGIVEINYDDDRS